MCAGTLVANCVACLLDYVVSFLLHATGVGSNLSTLSNWVVEVR
jgi:fluoride ion exporter CrcB/FEX